MIPENVLNIIKNNPDLVAKNSQYLKSIGILYPESLIHLKPELFILSNNLVRDMMKTVDINKVNEDPYSILEMV